MKHNLLSMVRLITLVGLIIFNLNDGFAQRNKLNKDSKSKVPEVLRDLKENQTAAMSRQATGIRKAVVLQVRADYVAIDAVAAGADGKELLQELQKLGLTHGSVYGRVVSGFFPIDKIDRLDSIGHLNYVSPAYKPVHRVGAVTSQGDAALVADEARKNLRVAGAGSKVGIISDSYSSDPAGVKAGIASGDLPADVEILSDFPDETDEGRAMAEIVHDVAPKAKIAFHSAYPGQAAFANGILKLAEAGSNIIVDDVIYFAEPMFQDGIIAQAVDEVVQKDVTYFSAAGNQARQSYQAAFKNSGKSMIVNGINYGVAHDFGNGDLTQTIRIPADGLFLIPFQWDDPFASVSGAPGARTDMDVLVFYEGDLITSLSSFEKNIGNDPIEFIGISTDPDFAADIEIAIVKYSGPDPKLIKWVNFGDAYPLEHDTNSATIYGHANARGAIAVGASYWFRTPVFNSDLETPLINYYSSAGGTPVFITKEGKRTKLTDDKIRKKPNVVGPDGGNTTFFGFDIPHDADSFPNFFGTSAAAPHTAAVAALMEEASNNTVNPDRIRKTLQATALDMNGPGFDFDTGYGFVNAFAAVETVAQQSIRYFTLIDADTGKEIQILKEGDEINLTRLPSRNVLFRASTEPARVGSVMFDLNRKEVTENYAPYDYPGTTGYSFTLTPGNYTLTATPFTRPKGEGKSGTPLTIHFKAVEEQIARFELINVENGDVLREIENHDVLDLAILPSKLNIRAITTPRQVGSVKFSLNDKITIENNSFYEVAGRPGNAIDFIPGDYSLTATIYPEPKARGTAGDSRTIQFKVVNSVDAPVASSKAMNAGENQQLVAYPNPFRKQVKINFSLPESGNANLAIYDLNGTRVVLLHDGEAEAGKQYEYVLDGTTLKNGLYISRLETSNGVIHQTLQLAK